MLENQYSAVIPDTPLLSIIVLCLSGSFSTIQESLHPFCTFLEHRQTAKASATLMAVSKYNSLKELQIRALCLWASPGKHRPMLGPYGMSLVTVARQWHRMSFSWFVVQAGLRSM